MPAGPPPGAPAPLAPPPGNWMTPQGPKAPPMPGKAKEAKTAKEGEIFREKKILSEDFRETH